MADSVNLYTPIMLDIPVKPHVKNYLMQNEFVEKPLRVNEKTAIGILILSLIEPKRRASLPLRYRKENVISVELGDRKEYNYKQWLPKKNAVYFNNCIDDLMRREFYQLIDNQMNMVEHAKIDPIIRQFERKYGLEETKLSFSSLKRMYYRSRGALKSREITS